MTVLFVKAVMGEEADLMDVSGIQQALWCPPLTTFFNGSRTERLMGRLPAGQRHASQHVHPVRWQKFTCGQAV